VIAAAAPVCLEGRCRALMKGLTQIGGLRFRVLRIGLCRETGVPRPQNCRLRSRLDGRVVTRCGGESFCESMAAYISNVGGLTNENDLDS
jgi:hypothetical protein